MSKENIVMVLDVLDKIQVDEEIESKKAQWTEKHN